MIEKSERIILDRTRQAAPQIVEYLRERILGLDLQPGALLSRSALQQQFGISQTPVRDALLKLEEEGLVTVFPQHATLVSRVDLDKARQAHFMRRAIEADIVRSLATEHPPGTVEKLRRANALVAVESEELNEPAFLLADRAFHQALFEQARMLQIWPIVRSNSGHLDRLRRLNLPNVGTERIVRQHERIIAMIAARDVNAAEAALRDHLANTLSTIDSIAEQYPDFIEH